MRCREAISLYTRVLLILLFFSYFLIKIPIFPIFSILSFLFSYFFEQPCRWTPCGISISIKMIASYLALFHELQYKKYKMLKKKILNPAFYEAVFKEYRVFSHDVTAAILVSQNNETAAMLVSQTNPLGVQLFSHANAFCCSNKFYIDAGHVSENTL